MHDGRFGTLEEVVAFYDAGVQPNPRLDQRLRDADGKPLRLGLSDAGRAALVAFLGALTDSAFLTSPRFANPFAAPGGVVPAGAAVTIRGSTFTPPNIVVLPGTVVSFTNFDNDSHSATFDNPAIAGTPVFTSGTKTVPMPNALGAYTYHCSIHARMTGSITVGR
jgi:plastocyanin